MLFCPPTTIRLISDLGGLEKRSIYAYFAAFASVSGYLCGKDKGDDEMPG